MYPTVLSRQARARMEDSSVAPYRDQKFSPRDVLGVGGAVIYDGFLSEREKDPRLAGTQKYVTFSEIAANTSIVATGVRHMLGLVTKPRWKWKPADDSPLAKQYAEEFEKVVTSMSTPWHRVVKRASMHRFYGFSVAEWVAKKNEDGTVGFLDVQPRPQSTIWRWIAERSGNVLGMVQLDPQSGVEIVIPRGKVLYCVDDAIDFTPQGMGLFRHLAQSATTLERLEQLEGWGFETDLRGVPLGRAPLSEMAAQVQAGKMPASEFTAKKEALEAILRGHVKSPKLFVLLDSITYSTTDERQAPSGQRMWDFEVIKGGSTGQAEVGAAIARINLEIARLLGCEHLLLGGDSSGSLALSRDKSKNVAFLVDGILGEVCEAVDRDLVRPWMQMNGYDEALAPSSETETTQLRDVDQITASLRDLATAGAVLAPNDPAINVVRGLMGLPEQIEVQAEAMADAMLAGAKLAAEPKPEPSFGTGEVNSDDGPTTPEQDADADSENPED